MDIGARGMHGARALSRAVAVKSHVHGRVQTLHQLTEGNNVLAILLLQERAVNHALVETITIFPNFCFPVTCLRQIVKAS